MRFHPAVALLLLPACHPQTPLPAAPPAHIAVPPRCEQLLQGRWVHTHDPRFVYDAIDNGKTLVLTQVPLTESMARDAGLEASPHAIEVVLERTPQGFSGEVRAQIAMADRLCSVDFPAEVAACSHEELRIRATPSRSIDATCQVAPTPAAPFVEQVLRRVQSGDAGQKTADRLDASP